uniref:Odorant binding protein 6 n=1 Tax=Cyrtorhinus lividipennis TaxID=1032904 RepID=A0A1W6AWH4_9HEMI|nr:odorant binding protein 6 [Cyrtorhinus lividipennis]
MKNLAILCLVASVVAVSQANPASTTSRPGSTLVSGSSTESTSEEEVSKSPEQEKLKIKEQVAALTETCKTQSKITGEQAKIVATQAIPKAEPEKCFLECIYKGLQLTKDNKFNEPAARALAQKRFGSNAEELQKANIMIDTCVKEIVIKDTNEKCVLGRLIRECFVKNGAKINFFPKP